MSIRAHFRLKPLIIGGAIVGAFVLGMVFGHLKPWQKKGLSAEDKEILALAIKRSALPRVFARCEAASIALPDNNDDRSNYILECMRGEGYLYDDHGKYCDSRTFQIANSECYQ